MEKLTYVVWRREGVAPAEFHAAMRGEVVAGLRDVANLVFFLASDESASCTGADHPIESGNTAGPIIPGAPGS